VARWNPTVANLTLMALGSSAPEILLSVIGTVKDLNAIPPVLGPSTIVGSAAFNLLVIIGVSIAAVDDTPKKINDLGVFAVTSIFSLWAYIWLFLVLTVISEGEVDSGEAWATLVFFVLLIVFAFSADKINSYVEDTKKTQEELEEQSKKDELKIKKGDLRNIAKQYGDSCVIEIAQSINSITA
jgi:solute carrier family 8 (sodium/calcium exchanger)